MLNLKEKNDQYPVCGHCKKEIDTIFFRKLRTILGQRYVYFCSNCRAVMGVSHRKGFWMG